MERQIFFRRYTYKGITLTMMLDNRNRNRQMVDDDGRKNVVVRIFFNKQYLYIDVNLRYSDEDWVKLCSYEKEQRKARLDERKVLTRKYESIQMIIENLAGSEKKDTNEFTFDLFKQRYYNLQTKDDTIYSVWEKLIKEKKEDGKIGTSWSYDCAYKRFLKDNGKKVRFTDINRNFLLKWAKKMRSCGLSDTSVGIYLRAFRVIINQCIALDYVSGDTKNMFKDTGYEKSASRKHEFIDVTTWKRLYDFWYNNKSVDKDGKELFPPKEKEAIFRDLGLLIFCYLGNGMNLNDALRLKYNGWYFATEGRQFQFFRHKTRDRNQAASEVIFPITDEIKEIIKRQGNKPKEGEFVFPIMRKYYTASQEKECVHRYTRYIREHMIKVSNLLNLSQIPTPTWARHSFATNLNNCGHVPYKYIADAMGHAGGGDITSRYIGEYPYEKMLTYNRYLLHENEKDDFDVEDLKLLEVLKGLSKEEREKLLQNIE